MYKIIGGDGNEYGPVDLEQIKQWIQAGRAGAQTKVQPEGATEWKTLGEIPELAELLGQAQPGGVPPTFTPMPSVGAATGDAMQMVQGPSIGLIVTAILGVVYHIASVLMNLLGVTMGSFQMGRPGAEEMPQWIKAMAGGAGVVVGLIAIAVWVVVFLGALKMKKLENYTLAIVASIIAMVPCVSPCCIVGLPIGIWALVVLNKPEVKGAFD